MFSDHVVGGAVNRLAIRPLAPYPLSVQIFVKGLLPTSRGTGDFVVEGICGGVVSDVRAGSVGGDGVGGRYGYGLVTSEKGQLGSFLSRLQCYLQIQQ